MIKWYRKGTQIFNQENRLIGVMESEALAKFVVELANNYWINIDEPTQEAQEALDTMSKLREQGVNVIAMTYPIEEDYS